jgi:hypothetical protein
VVSAVEHLGQALRLLEAEASEIEHRMSFVRAAIEAFGLDADSLLLDVIAEEERADVEYWQDAKLRADAAGIPPVEVVAPTNWVHVERPTQSPEELNGQFAAVDLAPEPPYGRTPEGRWDWHIVAQEIGKADTTGSRRALWLMDEFEVPATTAQWMVKRCREQGLIDANRPAVNHQAARDAAAAAL